MAKKKAAPKKPASQKHFCCRCNKELTSKPTQVTRQNYDSKQIIRKWFVCPSCGQSQIVRDETLITGRGGSRE